MYLVALSTTTIPDQGGNNCFKFVCHLQCKEDTPLQHNSIEKLKKIVTYLKLNNMH